MLKEDDHFDVSAADYGGSGATATLEEVDMQVMLDTDGLFHREMTYQRTACDQPIPHVGQWRRVKQYDGHELCPVCYTPAEIEKTRAFAAEKRRQENEAAAPVRALTSVEAQAEHEAKVLDWVDSITNHRPPKKR